MTSPETTAAPAPAAQGLTEFQLRTLNRRLQLLAAEYGLTAIRVQVGGNPEYYETGTWTEPQPPEAAAVPKQKRTYYGDKGALTAALTPWLKDFPVGEYLELHPEDFPNLDWIRVRDAVTSTAIRFYGPGMFRSQHTEKDGHPGLLLTRMPRQVPKQVLRNLDLFLAQRVGMEEALRRAEELAATNSLSRAQRIVNGHAQQA